MDEALRGSTISLAAAEDFSLGGWSISPSTRQMTHAGQSITLEPRVMQVLVALAEADGRVVSRDTLLERCWDGTIVSDNSINRVIANLRRLARETGAFTIETVARVGYRIIALDEIPPAALPDVAPTAPPVTARPAPASGVERRWLLAGGIAVLGAAGGALALRLAEPGSAPATHDPGLLDKARYLAEVDDRRAAEQALRLLEEATRENPGAGEAWGALALALADHQWMVWEEEAEDYGIRAANAAERALAIDADNADAAAALVIRRNWLGSWADHERGLRAVLARHPAHPRTRAELGFLFSEAGRWADALKLFETLAAADQLPARFHELHGTALAARGRRLDADRFLERAMTRWPGNSMLWAARFEFLLASGRLSEARAMVTERARFEMPNPPLPMDLGLKVATALEPRGSAGDRARAAADVLAARGSGGIWSPAAARLLVLLGEPRGALDIARAYLVGGTLPGGQTVAPPRGKRRSDFLFQSFMAPLRATDGFPALMTAIGLDAYWRQTRSAPQIIGWRH